MSPEAQERGGGKAGHGKVPGTESEWGGEESSFQAPYKEASDGGARATNADGPPRGAGRPGSPLKFSQDGSALAVSQAWCVVGHRVAPDGGCLCDRPWPGLIDHA